MPLLSANGKLFIGGPSQVLAPGNPRSQVRSTFSTVSRFPRAVFWTTVASEARHRFGTSQTFRSHHAQRKRRRSCALPAHSKTLRAFRKSSCNAPASWTAVALHRFHSATVCSCSRSNHSQKIGVSVKLICCDNGLLVANREHFIRHF
jgi:hypothetical protein